MTRDERQVVITGCGVLTPLGSGAAEVFDAACRKQSATTDQAPFDATGFDARVIGPLPADVDLSAGMRKDQVRYFRKNAKVMCRDTQIAVGSAGPAVADAGLPLGEAKTDPVLPTIDHARFGIIYGPGFIPPELDDFASAVAAAADEDCDVSLRRWGAKGIPLMTPLWLLKFLPNMLACHIGIIWDCQGPSNSPTCNEASGVQAVGEAFRHVARGTADIVMTGGGESQVNPSSILRQCLLGRAGKAFNERPESAQRPFDADRDGCICAEGAATLILEAADHAQARGAKPKARIAGLGSACATTLPNVVETSGAAIVRAIKAALRDAGLEPGDIDAVVAHGVAVPEQDVAEATAIRQTLGDVPVTTFSGGMGNIGAAHGPVGMAMACQMLARGKVPPIRNCERLDSRCPINVVMGDVLDKPLKRVMVVSAAIAAQSAAMVLEKV